MPAWPGWLPHHTRQDGGSVGTPAGIASVLRHNGLGGRGEGRGEAREGRDSKVKL